MQKQKKTNPIFLPHVEDIGAFGAHLSPTQHMIAGGLAGGVEHFALYPIDVVKTRMQAFQGPLYRNVGQALGSIYKNEGFMGLYRGMSAVLLASIPSHALYFAAYEESKKILQGGKNGPPSHIVSGISGVLATVAHDAVATPVDVVKQRLQIANSPYRSIMHCFTTTLRTEGVRAFYISYPTTLLMNIPYTSVHFIVYEATKHFLEGDDHDEHHHSPLNHILAGATAGAAGAAVSNPFDVIKTQLQTQVGHRYTGLVDASKIIYKEHGWQGFFRGMTPRMALCAPSAAITWLVYEYLKHIMR